MLEHLLRRNGKRSFQERTARALLGRQLRWRASRRRSAHAPLAPEDQHSRRPAGHRDHPRRGLHHQEQPDMNRTRTRAAAQADGVPPRAGSAPARSAPASRLSQASRSRSSSRSGWPCCTCCSSAPPTTPCKVSCAPTPRRSSISAAEGTFPRPLPNFALWPSDQVQVLAPDGAVLAATQYLEGRPAIYRLSPGSATPCARPPRTAFVPSDVLVFGEHVTVGGRPVTIITGTASSYSLLHRVNDTFTELMVLGVPGLLILACGTVWLVVGRALRPVEQIPRRRLRHQPRRLVPARARPRH